MKITRVSDVKEHNPAADYQSETHDKECNEMQQANSIIVNGLIPIQFVLSTEYCYTR